MVSIEFRSSLVKYIFRVAIAIHISPGALRQAP